MGAVDGRRQVRLPVRPGHRRPLRRPGRARAPGHLGRADRRQVEPLPRRPRRLRRPSQQRAAPGHRARVASSGRSSRCSAPTGRLMTGRRGPARDDAGVAGEAQAVVPPEEEGGRVTAGNSSQITDGASALLIMSEEKAAALGLTPRARFVDFALAGADPRLMLTAPIPATAQGARARRHVDRRHRPGRDQRGVRLRRAGLGAGVPPRHGARSTSTAGPSPSVTRSAAPAPG